MKRFLIVGIAPNVIQLFVDALLKYNFEVIIVEQEKIIKKYQAILPKTCKLIGCDISDYESLLSEFKSLNKEKRINEIYTFRDAPLIHVAKIAEQFSLTTNPLSTVSNCVYKQNTREILQKNNVDSIKFKICKNIDDVFECYDKFQNGIILKALDLGGSLGVRKIKNKKEITSVYKEITDLTKNSTILVEEIIIGEEISFDLLIFDKKVHLVNCAKKHLYNGTVVESGHTVPHPNTNYLFSRFKNWIAAVIDAMGIEFGPIFFEMIYNKNEHHLVEIHTRYGGDHLLTLSSKVYHQNFLEPIVHYFANINISLPVKNVPKGVSGVRYLDLPEGEVVKISGINECKNISGVAEVFVPLSDGDTISKMKSSLDRTGGVIAFAKDYLELNTIFDQVFNTLTIEIKEVG